MIYQLEIESVLQSVFMVCGVLVYVWCCSWCFKWLRRFLLSEKASDYERDLEYERLIHEENEKLWAELERRKSKINFEI